MAQFENGQTPHTFLECSDFIIPPHSSTKAVKKCPHFNKEMTESWGQFTV